MDSAGNPTGFDPSDSGIAVPMTEFESAIIPLPEGGAAILLEATANRTRFQGSNSGVRNWQWNLIGEKSADSCSDLKDYDRTLAADSLRDACADQSGCEIGIAEVPSIDATEFIISLPVLKSPVALQYTVSAELNDGQYIERTQTLCGLSINERPSASDDNYRAIAGASLVVLSTDEDNLLVNDIDDIDARNLPLQVRTQAVQVPRFADQFELQTDGGFIYRAAANAPLDENGKLTDSFIYSVTDGSHDSHATATITIVDDNTGPQAVGNLPDVELDMSSNANNTTYELDVTPYFSDEDNDALSYRVEGDNLPQAASIQINNQGLLMISVESLEQLSETGTWPIEVQASDRLSTVSAGFLLTVVDTRQINRAPTVDDIANRTVTGTFTYDISVFFEDLDDDQLMFTTSRLPPGVQLSSAGTLTGISSNRNEGRWFISIEATDPSGESVSDGFALQIQH